MKKLQILLLFALGASSFNSTEAQNPTYKQRLYYTCKVWGFVKYFHSNVSICGVNWDSVLITYLPLVKSAVTDSEFNNALDTILNAAGPMAITHAPPCDTVPPELSRNLNFGWITNPIFRADVQTILDTIKNNFRPHAECSVEVNPPRNVLYSYLKFQSGDSLILNINDNAYYPDERHRLLELFVHWNIVNYFNPYNYIQNQPWDSTLYQNIINIDSANNDAAFYTAFKKITSNMDDFHVQAITYDNYCFAPENGLNCPDIALKYIPGKYVVVKSGVSGITIGDEIISINGLTMKQWEDSLKPYISAGDSMDFHYWIAQSMTEYYDANMTISYLDSLNNVQTNSFTCNTHSVSYFPNDTLANVQWKYWGNCNVGYVNVGEMQDTGSEVADMYATLQNTNAIIFDIRNYPASTAVYTLVDNYLYPYPAIPFVKFMMPDVTYPGTYYWEHIYAYPGSANPYSGKVIVLFNEQTFSQGEYVSMILGQLPNSIKIGSQTAGTDGNITYYDLSQDMETGFTTLGTFYPNGDSTERIGILPDIIAYPTQEGIRQGRDEVLEKALEVAGCPLSVPTLKNTPPRITVYPNPSNGIFTFDFSSPVTGTIEVYNVLGEQVYNAVLPQTTKGALTAINISNQPNGIYLYRVISESGNLVGEGKLIIQK